MDFNNRHFYQPRHEADLPDAKIIHDGERDSVEIAFQDFHTDDSGHCTDNIGVYFDGKHGKLSRITIYELSKQPRPVLDLVRALLIASPNGRVKT